MIVSAAIVQDMNKMVGATPKAVFAGSAPSRLFTLSLEHYLQLAEQYRAEYATNAPYPHAVIDDFLPEEVADEMVSVFPSPEAPYWLDWTKRDQVHHPRKQGIGNAERLENAHPFIHHVLSSLNSYQIVRFLEVLTNIECLLPDPHLRGGGLHQILPMGSLAIHADFNFNPHSKLFRRVNLLLYLNKGWKPSYAGELEMWNRDMTACIKKVEPLFNRAVVFNTTRFAYHGHPTPLNCPADMTRKSLALYYYTRDSAEDGELEHSVLWQERPEDQPSGGQ